MKRVLLWLLTLPLAAVLGLFAYSWWRERSFDAEHPPPGKLFEVGPGARVHAMESLGAEPTVVFIHGNPGTGLDFAPVMQSLSPRVRSVALDRPGYGWSSRSSATLTPLEQARQLREATLRLGLERPVLAGFSYGGPVALAWALEFPDEVSALVLIAAVGSPEDPHRMGATQARLLAPSGPLLAWGLGPILGPDAVSQGYVEAFAPKPVVGEVVERGRIHFTRPPSLLASARDWQVLDSELPALAARYPELRLPVEILSANQDRVVGPKHAAYLSQHLPGAHRVDLDDAGHQLMSTHTQAVVEAVMRALARVPR